MQNFGVQLPVGLLAGALAGLAALGLDQLMVFLALGSPISVLPRFVGIYLGCGAILGILVQVVRGLALALGVSFSGVLAHSSGRRQNSLRSDGGRRPEEMQGLLEKRRRAPGQVRTGWGFVFSMTLVLIYGISVGTRLGFLAGRLLPWPSLVAFLVTVIGFGVWILVLRWILSGRRVGTRGTPTALVLASVSAAAVLGINRHLVSRPLEPLALAADVGVATLVLAAAAACRVWGLGRVGSGVVVLIALLAGGTMARSSWSSTSDGMRRSPHLILVIIDTLRLDVFQRVVDETEEGRAFHRALGPAAWFENAIAAGPWTAPSVASIMTGLYPAEHGFGSAWKAEAKATYRRLADGAGTLAEGLRKHGYRTEALVTNAVVHPVSGLDRGFDHYELLVGSAGMLPLLTAAVHLGQMHEDIYQPSAVVTRRLRQRLGRIDPEAAPLFLWLHLMDPHGPLRPHRDLSEDPRAGDLPESERLYRDEIRYTLRELRSMLELLRSKHLFDDAVFVLVSDHGEMFKSDGHVVETPGHPPRPEGHGHALYGELMRVPLVIRPAGGLPEERRLDVLTSHTDLYDTLAELLGVNLPPIEGDRVSLAPWLAPQLPEEEPQQRTYVLVGVNSPNLGPPQRGLRGDTLNYIHFPNGEMSDELYDLTHDPGEVRNLAEDEPDRLSAAREILGHLWSGLREAPGEVRPVDLDEETRRRLEALGYL